MTGSRRGMPVTTTSKGRSLSHMPITTKLLVQLSMIGALASSAAAQTWEVADAGALDNALNSYASGDEIVIAPGTYQIGHQYELQKPKLTIRGKSGKREDVIIVGGGMEND